MFAQIGMEHALRHGTTIAQFAQVAVKNHAHGALNPKATMRRETPLEEVLASDMIATPLTKLMCSISQPMPYQQTKSVSTARTSVRPRVIAAAAVRWLGTLPGNQNRPVTQQQIASMLDKNPTYIELCEMIEQLGFKVVLRVLRCRIDQ